MAGSSMHKSGIGFMLEPGVFLTVSGLAGIDPVNKLTFRYIPNRL